MIKILFLLSVAVSLWASIGQVVVVNGSAFIVREKKEIPAVIDMKIEKNDEIVTKKRARIKIRLEDDTMLSLGQNSRFSISDYMNSKEKPGAQFKVSKGFFKVITGTVGKIAPEKFKIKTNNATIGIRGTTVMGEVREDFELIMCTDGAIYIVYEGDTYEVKRDQLLKIKKTQTPKIESVSPGLKSQFEELTGWVPVISSQDEAQYYRYDDGKFSSGTAEEQLDDEKETEAATQRLNQLLDTLEDEREVAPKHDELGEIPQPPSHPDGL